ncbi:unnamed protein product [Amaranthus hypochondriacus]
MGIGLPAVLPVIGYGVDLSFSGEDGWCGVLSAGFPLFFFLSSYVIRGYSFLYAGFFRLAVVGDLRWFLEVSLHVLYSVVRRCRSTFHILFGFLSSKVSGALLSFLGSWAGLCGSLFRGLDIVGGADLFEDAGFSSPLSFPGWRILGLLVFRGLTMLTDLGDSGAALTLVLVRVFSPWHLFFSMVVESWVRVSKLRS